ncbi:MAG: hypothetical protein ACK4LB_08595 [Spirosomataceae bacterium]
MMKKSILLLSFLFSSIVSNAQLPVFQSKELVLEQVKSGYYVLLPSTDVTQIIESWQRFLQREGKLQKNDLTIFQVSQPTSAWLRDLEITMLSSQITAGKGFTKVFCAFESTGRTRNTDFLRNTEVVAWFQPFINEVLAMEGKKMLGLELDQLQAEQKSMDRDVARLQSSIERNLKQQNKLDASIRNTPEELSKIISEKEELTQSLLQQDVSEEELIKQSAKKEKSISRIKSQAKKQEKQLSSKERALQKLRTEFLQKEKERKQHAEVLNSKPPRS